MDRINWQEEVTGRKIDLEGNFRISHVWCNRFMRILPEEKLKGALLSTLTLDLNLSRLRFRVFISFLSGISACQAIPS